MGLRPAKCYRNTGHKQRAYTRVAVKVPKRNYIGAAPALRIRQFNMGNPMKKYNTVANLVVEEYFDLRDNAIESARIAINRKLVKELGKDGYFMKVRVYPSHIVRENKQAQGAGADRVSQGMTLAFGVPTGRAARVRKGQAVFSVLCDKDQKKIVKEALMRAKAKFSSSVDVEFHEDVKKIGTIPKKEIEEIEIETEEAEVEKAEGAEGEKAEGTEEEKKEGEKPSEENTEAKEEKK